MESAATIRLCTLGPVHGSSATGENLHAVAAQPRRVALLIYLVLAQPRGFHTRDQLLALFWPEHDEQRARNALSQAVHFLRRTLGTNAIVSGADDQLRANADLIWCDAIAFEAAVNVGQLSEALALYRGPFIDGFFVSSASPELDRWVEGERDRLGRLYQRALRQMADDTTATGDFAGAIMWHRKLAALDPLSSRAALGLIRALAASGELAGALQYARIYETLLREDLATSPESEFVEFVRAVRARAESPAPSDKYALVSEPGPARHSAPPAEVPGVASAPTTNIEPPRRRRVKYAGLALGGLLAASLALLTLAAGRHDRPPISCIAVLPIDNLSRDSTLEPVADAMTDVIITELGRYQQPQVRGRGSVLTFKNARKPIPEIGRELNCDGVVEASITRSGAIVHVDARILNASDDKLLWAQPFETDTSRTLVMQRTVTDAVVRHVQRLGGLTLSTPQPRRYVEPVVYQMYLRGRDQFRSRNAESLRQAVEWYQQAIDRDPKFAQAYAGLADAYNFIGGQGYGPVDYLDSARALTARALALDSTASEAHTTMAAILTGDGNWTRAESEFRRAIDLQPSNALAHHWFAFLLAILNRREEALDEIRLARNLDPMSQAIQGSHLEIEFFSGAKAPLGNPGSVKGMVDPMHAGSHAALGIGLARKGRCTEAYAANQRAQQLAPDNTLMLISLVGVHVLCGDSTRGRALLEQVEHRPDARLMAVHIAAVYTQEKKFDSAFAWLDKSRWLLPSYYELRVNRYLTPLRSDHRYAELLRRLQLPL
jgi:DNA-binding SARP family transcriptional activator/TolB-like protein/Flp pilus assembly protein TadD